MVSTQPSMNPKQLSPNGSRALETFGTAHFQERAEAFAAQGLWNDALVECSNAIEMAINLSVVLSGQVMLLASQGKLSTTGELGQRIRSIQESLAASYFLRGSIYLQGSQKERACIDFSHVLQLAPNHAEARAARGEVYFQLGNTEAALTDYNVALHHDPACNRALVGRGNLFLDQGNLSTARDDFSRVILNNSSSVDAYFGRGRCQVGLGNLESARADFDQAIALKPDHASAFFHRGCCYRLLHDPISACIDLERALQLDPNLTPAYLERARAYQSQGRSAQSLADFNLYLSQEPNSLPALLERGKLHRDQGNHDLSALDLSEALRLNPCSASILLQRALTYCLKGDSEAAAIDLREALLHQSQPEIVPSASTFSELVVDTIRETPTALSVQSTISCLPSVSGELFIPTFVTLSTEMEDKQPLDNSSPLQDAALSRGAAVLEKGDPDGALVKLKEPVCLGKESADFYREKGRDYLLKKHLAEAIEQFTHAIRLDPTDVDALLGRGNAYAETGNIPSAIADYSTVLQSTPDSIGVLQNRAYLLAKLGKFELAVLDAEEAVRLQPDSARGHFVAAVARAGLRQFPASLSHFESAIELNPNDPMIYYKCGLIRARTGDWQGALADFDQVLRLRPDFSHARYQRAIALRESGSPSSSLEAFNDYISQYPIKADTYYQRALTFRALGERQCCQADLERALRIKPNLTAASDLRIKLLRQEQVEAASISTLSPLVEKITRIKPETDIAELTSRSIPAPEESSSVSEDGFEIQNPTEPFSNRKESITMSDRSEPGKIRLTCPGCGQPGNTRWNRLDRMFQCIGCGCISRPDATGRLLLVVRAKACPNPKLAKQVRRGDLPLNAGPSFNWNLIKPSLIIACLVSLVGLFGVMMSTGAKSHLQARGVDLTRAWLSQDTSKMKDLTDPEVAKDIEAWLVRNPPPDFIRSAVGAKPGVEVSIRRKNGKASDIAAKIETKSSDGGPPLIYVMYQHWEEKDGRWYFSPDTGP